MISLFVLASVACSFGARATPTLNPLQAAWLTITALPSRSSTPTETGTPTTTPTPSVTPRPPTLTPTPAPTLTPTASVTPTPLRTPIFSPVGEADCVPTNTAEEFGRVKYVIEGDVIGVEIEGSLYEVRYIGLDAPQDFTVAERYAVQARRNNIALVQDQEVLLVSDVEDRDQFDRLLRYVFLGDVFVNYELILQGDAFAIPSSPNDACGSVFEDAQRRAQRQKVGVWKSVVIPTGTPFRVIFPTVPPNIGGIQDEGPCPCNGPELSCGDFYTQDLAQACYLHCLIVKGKDIFHLDPDKDGLACDYLP
jgi:micrococcal nuclease